MSSPPLASTRLAVLRMRCALCCAAVLLWLACAPAAQAFDRQAQTQRYQQWLADFERDLRQLAAVPDPTDADVERIFADTVVPSSRAVAFVRQLAAQPAGTVSGEIAYQGRARLLLGLLRQSVVAGDGGPYTDAPPGQAPQRLRAWYLHIDGGGQLERHFNDPDAYKPYRLPPDGTLARGVYPFLVFEDGPRLRLGAMTREYWDVVRFLDGLQHG
ncbi:hypothetical protein A9G00_25460 [Achromobacter xylosoxidans]|nr:hypothetical protein A7P23_15820 [Achromobacter xylosoxidans]OCZ93298.1 hypothetical protein A9G00_25460 [Achromobacter xylosoxidans]